MHRKIAGLIGVVSAAVTLDAAQAAMHQQPSVDPSLSAGSFADLLTPIPNAVALLKASDAALTQQEAADAKIEPVDYYYPHHHHHHFRRFFYHHHHHHHHYFYHHHHHHHYYRY